jgi:aquaporin Z|mmetsp:Transcript_50845/g.80591  ORF Transcript_50845/g.80591 Transcript_50845/m.80591 type:complete len:523 (-) Transcript_50845:52-1620(-)|eukprot:CAMPEP_0169083982 /NCGR_PEP_ID=MMETSP1015-20121227/12368_1 /TAXON_ID=342587 /ORGANISM="Karlodinium micrum, Strain CCMP2283" /LENGTH=522 /DNA_ID=CAMNT_0009143941 /DNA_START=119 /DNA_END=1687 /DNA_ORIENTATION=+
MRAKVFHAMMPKCLAEFVGTYFLVLTVGCNVHTGSIGAALSIGAILMVMVYSLGSVSGAHLNPAVTVAIALSGRGKIKGDQMLWYIVSQLLGGFLAALTYLAIFDDAFALEPQGHYSLSAAIWVEILYTAALCYVVLNVATTVNKAQGNCDQTDSNVINDFFGVAIGLTVTAAAIAIGPISGCSLNPAVSVGALWASKLAHGPLPTEIWAAYCFSPVVGAALAALFFFFVQGGLTGRFEYDSGAPAPRPSPVLLPRRPYKKKTIYLNKNECIEIPEEVETHRLVFGMSWETDLTPDSVAPDFDVSCVVYGSEGEQRNVVYFTDPFGKLKSKNEDLSKSFTVYNTAATAKDAIIAHRGDNATGGGHGLSGTITGVLERKRKASSKNRKAFPEDDEQIVVNNLSRLRQTAHGSKDNYLFFTMNVFSSNWKDFDRLKSLSIRLVDADDDSFVLCTFEKAGAKDFAGKNGFLMGVLFWKEDRWYFKVVSEGVKTEQHGTYRGFEAKCKEIVRRLEGAELVRETLNP